MVEEGCTGSNIQKKNRNKSLLSYKVFGFSSIDVNKMRFYCKFEKVAIKCHLKYDVDRHKNNAQ